MRQSNLKVVFLICIFNFSFAQQMDAGYEPVEIGDTVPDITLTNLINYPIKTAKLSDFREKLLILDFWSTGCASCIESWPKLVSLQKKFSDRIQIILINSSQEESIVRPLIEKREKVLGIDMSILPVLCGDTIPKQLFPYEGVPHIVWIDSDGVVYSITYGNDLKEENIRALLEGRNVVMHEKGRIKIMPKKRKFNLREPLFIKGNGQEELAGKLISQSVLTEADSSFSGNFNIFPREGNKNFKDCKGMSALNASIKGLYAFAYEPRDANMVASHSRKLMEHRPGERILFDLEDSTKYKNYYNYQLTVHKPTSRRKLQEMMRLDLEKYFGLKARWEKRSRQCLVFSIADTTRISYNGSEKTRFIINDVEFKVSGSPSISNIRRYTMSEIVDWMETVVPAYIEKWPIIDETGVKGPVSIDLEADVFNYEKLHKALYEKYGMRLALEEREVGVLVLYETKVANK